MISKPEAHQRLRSDVADRAVKLSHLLDRNVPIVLKWYGVSYQEQEPGGFDEVALNAAKDLEKLAIYQDEDVDQHKQFGYLAFWIRKLKPIKVAFSDDKKAVARVNELLSLWFAGEMLITHVSKTADAGIRDSLTTRIRHFLKDAKTMDYIVHCLRARTFGPHHYVIMLKQLTIV